MKKSIEFIPNIDKLEQARAVLREGVVGRIERVHDHGHVILTDFMGSDEEIAHAARVSYAEGTQTLRSDLGLLDFLMRHQHTSPFEMVEFKFQIKLPLYVAAHFVRHRTASMNAKSFRYSVIEEEFHVPKTMRLQSQVNKQSSEGVSEIQFPEDHYHDAVRTYHELLAQGVAREQARTILPQNLYTEIVWKQDLHNLLRLLQLRMDPTAQEETQDYAAAMLELIRPVVPVTIKAWENHVLNSVTLSSSEVDVLRSVINGEDNPYEGLSAGRARELREKINLIYGEKSNG